jgi:hypothetical protein
MRRLRLDPEMRWAACATSFTGVSARPAMNHPRMPPNTRAPGTTLMKIQVKPLWILAYCASGIPSET